MAESAMQGMQEVTKYPPGAFSWADLLTTDVEAAKRFYGALFGWTFQDWPMGEGMFYTFAHRYDKPVAGMMADPTAPPTWQLYVTVEDADALARTVRAAGGAVPEAPVDVFDNGRMFHFQDPTGGVLAVWQPYNFAGTGLSAGPGVPVWFELWTGDVAAAVDFYGKVFGWRGGIDQSGEYTYAGLHNGEAPVTVIMSSSAQFGEPLSGWVLYFGSADVPADAAKVQELGGVVTYGPTEMSGYPFAICRDPQGAVFLLMGIPQGQG